MFAYCIAVENHINTFTTILVIIPFVYFSFENYVLAVVGQRRFLWLQQWIYNISSTITTVLLVSSDMLTMLVSERIVTM